MGHRSLLPRGHIPRLLLRSLGHQFISTHIYWMLMGGVIFYAPIMVDSFIHGTLEATSTVAIFGLWVIFSVGLTIGSKISRGA